MSTQDNLMAAFAGESQANRKYLAYAKEAEKAGLPQVAKLFRAAAEAETVHAHTHLRNAGGINDTIANLKDAIAGESHEFKSMYPGFIEEAEKEGVKGALKGFQMANTVEEIHFNLYSEALKSVEGGSDLPEQKIFVCSVCGNTVYGEAEDKCSVCNVAKDKFFEVK